MTTQIQRRWGILALAVVMFLVTLIVTNINGAKTSLYYYVWLMVGYYAYKDRLEDLKLMMKIVIFINVTVIAAVTLLADENLVNFLSKGSKLDLLASVLVMLLPKIFIFYYCRKKLNNVQPIFAPSNPNLENSVGDEHYAKAMHELASNQPRDGLWARCLANSGGDDSRAKSDYIRIRAIEFSQEKSRLEFNSIPKQKNRFIFTKESNKVLLGTAVCIGVTFCLWLYFISFHTNNDNELGNLVRNSLQIKSQANIKLKKPDEPNEGNRIAILQQEYGTGKGLTLSQVRGLYPTYNDLSDEKLSDALYEKYYKGYKKSDVNQVLNFKLRID